MGAACKAAQVTVKRRARKSDLSTGGARERGFFGKERDGEAEVGGCGFDAANRLPQIDPSNYVVME